MFIAIVRTCRALFQGVKLVTCSSPCSVGFLEILASTYGYGPGPLIIWKDFLSQICSRTIFKMRTAPGACLLYALGAVYFSFSIFFKIINGTVPYGPGPYVEAKISKKRLIVCIMIQSIAWKNAWLGKDSVTALILLAPMVMHWYVATPWDLETFAEEDRRVTATNACWGLELNYCSDQPQVLFLLYLAQYVTHFHKTHRK